MGIDEVPAPLGHFGQTSIKDFLKKGLPATPRETLTETMQKNLEGYEKLIEKTPRWDPLFGQPGDLRAGQGLWEDIQTKYDGKHEPMFENGFEIPIPDFNQ